MEMNSLVEAKSTGIAIPGNDGGGEAAAEGGERVLHLRRPIVKIPRNRISSIVDYLRDERKHCEENPSARHIYHDVLAVSDWLDSLPPAAPPESAIGMNEVPFAPR
jgi:hypothetical protein